MSELRKDIISGRWVIIAAERSKRPDDFRPARTAEKEEGKEQAQECEQETESPKTED